MTPLIAGNWKMNKLPSESEDWALAFKDALHRIDLKAEVLVCAPFTHLLALKTLFADSPVQVGAQDVSPFEAGAYTGEVSAAMLADAGATYAIVGHSERREYHAEGDALVNAKVLKALEHGLRPILCVGESAAQRDAGEQEEIVLRQLRGGLDRVTFQDPADLVIAYEPIWAIGTGKTATAGDAQEMSAALRRALRDLYPAHAEDVRVLYGGSMKPGNAAELLAKRDVNGGLVGGASLDVDDFAAILKAATVAAG